jgi:dienelactone hydrolase
MALWCDMRVAAKSAVFGCFERRFGVPLVDGGTQRLPRVVGHGIAMEMILTGRPVEAEEAYVIGLANLIVGDGKALEAAVKLARSLAAFPQPTLRADRMAVLDGADLPIEEGLAVERRYGNRVMGTAKEGAQRFAGGAGRGGAAIPEVSLPGSWKTPVVGGPLTFAVDGARVPLHTAVAQTPGAPAVLVLHDRWGFDDHPRLMADLLAKAGFHAVAIGMFEPPEVRNGEEADRLVETLDRLRIERILDASMDLLRTLPEAVGSPALLGFGIGGGLAMALAGRHPDVSACVAYTPTSPWSGLSPDFGAGNSAVLGHYAAMDDRASPHTAYQLEMRLRERGIDVTFETYRRAGPEFYRPDRPRYHDPDATELAWARTVAFLQRVQ